MARLFVVRHADAGTRKHGGANDELRPLSDRGLRQAQGIAEALAEKGITRLVSSPYLRCVQTLEPLGKALGVKVEIDERLSEGMGFVGALELADELRTAPAALCSHGDVIPDVLEALLRRGTKFEDDLRWQKASTWVLKRDGEEFSKARYLPPPA